MTPENFANQAMAMAQQNRLPEALACFDKALALSPGHGELLHNRGVILQQLGRLEEAVASYDRALASAPGNAGTHYNRGNALVQLKRMEEAVSGYDRALKLAPGNAQCLMNRGYALSALGRTEEARIDYARAVQLQPGMADGHYNLGLVLAKLNRNEEALAAHDAALRLRPDYAQAHNDRGNALVALNRPAEAIPAFEQALRLKGDFGEAWYNRGVALGKLARVEEAIASLDRAVRLKPDNRQALVLKAYLKAKICDWSSNALPPGVTGDAEPFLVLGMDDDPAGQLARARHWAHANYPVIQAPLPKAATRPQKLRIGYFSADFHDHPVMQAMARLFELHDRNRFEVHLFSLGPDKSDAMRQRALRAADHFHDVRTAGDGAIVKLARATKIDIAVDLMGYTKGSRTEIFAHRVAPLQLNYLGYPGTLGADFIDHIIADPWVIPEGEQRFYAEKVLRLQRCFMATDNSRAAAQDRFTRAQFGLPDDGIVFCCFNNGYKITPAEFSIWMRLLGKVAGSVLWLPRDSEAATANLTREAAACGIAPHRLVFAERMPDHADYLARYRCADLFLDTFNYNAHVTASDALWAGLPIVTRSGSSFPARVAGSLLGAIGLPELVTQTPEAYEALALDLATRPDRLAATKAKLAANRLTTPLFDSEGFTRDIERLYDALYS